MSDQETKGELENPPEQHWPGYSGEAPAESYPVVDRGKYVLLFVLVILAFVATAIAVLIHHRAPIQPTRSVLTAAGAFLAKG